ncbi:MAG: GntR family transcriptional regulator [Pseudomonadota bacterium]
MRETAEPLAPRTTTDMVFDRLHEEILTLKLLPGSKMSEAEVARRMGVSRQPVRDAFNRLGNLDLLLIRPQRATEVRGFSMKQIENARFIRLAVELEVVRRACAVWDAACAQRLEANLIKQRDAIDAGQTDRFHALDYRFHWLICELGGYPLAFETIEQCKRKVDRLCMLSLSRAEEVTTLLEDHRKMAHALGTRSTEEALETTRRHLSRLDGAINDIHMLHSEYFE